MDGTIVKKERQSAEPGNHEQGTAVAPCRRKKGQVLVEMALMLPWFFTVVFSIMEMGNLAFHMIIINHAAYETARYGAMVVVPPDGGNPQINKSVLDDFVKQILKAARVDDAYSEDTLFDPQAKQQNSDLVVTIAYDVQLIFPISNIIFSKPPGRGKREVKAIVRMPIERPLKR